MPGGWVNIMTNRPNGILYTGVTSDIARRAYEHREGLVPLVHPPLRPQAPRLDGTARRHPNRDPARKEHQTLVARLEGADDHRGESVLARPL